MVSQHSVPASAVAIDVTATSQTGALDEQVLVACIRGGDAAAFETMFHAYYRPLCNFLLPYLRSRELAEEQVQDLLFWVWERRADLHVHTGLRTYLYVAARNRAMNWLKHQRVVTQWSQQAVPDLHLTGAGMGPRSAEDDLRDRELAVALAHAIASLPERRRVAFTLAWQHGFSNVQIAEIMGISVKGVEVARARALDSLRKALVRHR